MDSEQNRLAIPQPNPIPNDGVELLVSEKIIDRKEYLRTYLKRYRVEKREEILAQRAEYRARSKEKLAFDDKQYFIKRPGLRSAVTGHNRAIKLQRTPKWLTKLQRYHSRLFYECATAMSKETGIKFHVDHIVPLRSELVSGLHVPWNLQVIPASMNCAKGNKLENNSQIDTKSILIPSHSTLEKSSDKTLL